MGDENIISIVNIFIDFIIIIFIFLYSFTIKLDSEKNSLNGLSDFEKEAIRDDKLIKKSFGRFNTYLISSRDFFNISSKLIKQDEYALIHESGHE